MKEKSVTNSNSKNKNPFDLINYCYDIKNFDQYNKIHYNALYNVENSLKKKTKYNNNNNDNIIIDCKNVKNINTNNKQPQYDKKNKYDQNNNNKYYQDIKDIKKINDNSYKFRYKQVIMRKFTLINKDYLRKYLNFYVVDGKKKKCEINGCYQLAIFGNKKNKIAKYCRYHKGKDDINLVSRNCDYKDCENISCFYNTINKDGKYEVLFYCRKHKNDTSVYLRVSAFCRIGNCMNQVRHLSNKTKRLIFCADHDKESTL